MNDHTTPPPQEDEAHDRGPSSRPSVRELEVLHAVIGTRKTTAAARRLGVSQPAVSRAIAALEGRLRRPLFRRDGGRLVPTAEALALDAEAEPVFAALARMEHWPRPPAKQGLLRIATTTSLAGAGLANLVARFHAAEAVALRIDVGCTGDAVAAVAEGSADLGLVDLPFDHAGVRVEAQHHSQAHCLMRADHKLARRERVTPMDLAGEPCLALTRRFAARAHVDAAFADAGVRPSIAMEAASLDLVIRLVLAGAGLAVVDPFAVGPGLDAGLVMAPFEPAIPFASAFLTPAAGHGSPMARRFVDFATAFAASIESEKSV